MRVLSLPTMLRAEDLQLGKRWPLAALFFVLMMLLIRILATLTSQFDPIFKSIGIDPPFITRAIICVGVALNHTWVWSTPILATLFLVPMLCLNKGARLKYGVGLFLYFVIIAPLMICVAIWIPLQTITDLIQELN